MFRSKQFIIGMAVSLIFLGWALWKTDLADVWSALLRAEYWALIPALVLYFVGVGVRAIRWRILLRPVVPNISIGETFRVVTIGYMANNILPARIGELVRAYVLSRREGVRKTATLATIFVERVFDGLTMVGFAAAVIFLLTALDPDVLSTGANNRLGKFLTDYREPFTWVAIAFLVLLVIFIAVASSRTLMSNLVTFGLRFLPGRLHDRGERLASSFIHGLTSLRNPAVMLAVFGLSLSAWIFETGMYYIIGTWGFSLIGGNGEPLPFYAYVLATAFINLSTLIPQAPGYVGVFEAVAKIVFVGAFGVADGSATSYVLVLHAALLIPVTALGFVYLWRESLSWRDLTDLEKTRARASEQAHELEGPLTDIELVQEDKITAGEAEVKLEQAGEQPPRNKLRNSKVT